MRSCYILSISLFVLFICCEFSTADLPPEVTKCHAGDVKCIAKIIPELFQRYPNGNKEFGLPDLDKLQLKDVVISKANGQEAIALDLIFKVFNLHGISNLTVERVVGFETDPLKSKFEVYCTIPELVLNGDFVADGKVLVLPINGEGFAEIRLKNAKLSLKFKMDEVRRDGKQFVKIQRIKGEIEPELMHVYFENLIKGNTELSNSINAIINENWKQVWDEMRTEINAALVRIINELLKFVLESLPYDDFYKKD